jgi:hypothetical protein
MTVADIPVAKTAPSAPSLGMRYSARTRFVIPLTKLETSKFVVFPLALK